jgi:peptide deformylase
MSRKNRIDDSPIRICRYGNPSLRKKTDPVVEFNPELREFALRMADVMYAENGIGLAAPQVGVPQKVIVIDLSFGEEVDNVLAMVNPEILEIEGECSLEEGCLSVPGVYEQVVRPERIRVRYCDLDGSIVETDANGYLARVMQHEIDHLEGILFVDRIGAAKKALLAKTLREIAEENGEEP